MSLIICKLPKTGLGNQLFPLTRAFLFGHLNSIPVMVTGYNQLKIGPYLRGDKSKRNYKGYFNFEKGWLNQQFDKCSLLQYWRHKKVLEPSICKIGDAKKKKVYIFNKLPHWSDYFQEFKDHRQLVIQLFMDSLSPVIKKKFNQCRPPVIGVHIRMGDFRKLKAGEDFSKVGVVRTPIKYFIDVIRQIRKVYGSDLPVSVFSDSYEEQLEDLLYLNNIAVEKGNPDIIDLLLLSKSKIIITSSGSTFSYWAGFLSEAPLIMHPDHIHQSIRPPEMQKSIYEGAFNAENAVLVNNIKAIR